MKSSYYYEMHLFVTAVTAVFSLLSFVFWSLGGAFEGLFLVVMASVFTLNAACYVLSPMVCSSLDEIGSAIEQGNAALKEGEANIDKIEEARADLRLSSLKTDMSLTSLARTQAELNRAHKRALEDFHKRLTEAVGASEVKRIGEEVDKDREYASHQDSGSATAATRKPERIRHHQE